MSIEPYSIKQTNTEQESYHFTTFKTPFSKFYSLKV